MERHEEEEGMKTLLMLVLAAGLWAGPVEAGWADLTVGQWRKTSQSFRTGVVVGAMNTWAQISVRCRTPISADMVMATINGTGDGARGDDEAISEAVWHVMTNVYGCEFGQGTPGARLMTHLLGKKNSTQPPSAHTQ